MITPIIVLTNRTERENNIFIIAECNIYDNEDNIIQQLSRSPFNYPNTFSDIDIINSLKVNEYSIYFS